MHTKLTKTDTELKEKFFHLKSPFDVANLLEVKYKTLVYLLYRTDGPESYTEFYLKKKSGGERAICAPISTLKIIQKKLSTILYLVYEPKPSAHGFCIKRGIHTNAQQHIKKKIILNVDLEDFFPSINFGRVRGLFIAKPYSLPQNVSTLLAQICCHDGKLPQGAPTSPIVSNMICARLDSNLQRFAKAYKCAYTRYADDITFSTTSTYFARELRRNNGITMSLVQIIKNNGFKMNEDKMRILSPTQRQTVTGLVVNEGINVRRKFVREVRAMLHAWEKYGEKNAEAVYYRYYNKKQRGPYKSNPEFCKIVEGRINFIKMIKSRKHPVYIRLLNKFNKLKGNGIPPYPLNAKEEIEAALWVVGEEGKHNGTAFMLENKRLVTCSHVLPSSEYKIRVYKLLNGSKQQEYPVSIVSNNKALDLAILEIHGLEHKHSCYLRIGDGGLVVQGSSVTVAGFCKFSVSFMLYDSKVAGTRARLFIQHMILDRPLYTGMSGSPVLNEQNEVIGVATIGTEHLAHGQDAAEYGVKPINYLSQLS
jgi:RNA-directed DNA polymerase